MKEKYYAYQITLSSSNLICKHSEIEEKSMLDLLKEILENYSEGLFWIFKQFGEQPKEQLCIIDCHGHRIYYHYSGDVEDLQVAINKLSQ